MNNCLAERLGGQKYRFTGRVKFYGKNKRELAQVEFCHLTPNESGEYPFISTWIPIEYLNDKELKEYRIKSI